MPLIRVSVGVMASKVPSVAMGKQKIVDQVKKGLAKLGRRLYLSAPRQNGLSVPIV